MPLRTLKLHGAFQTTLRSSTLRRLGRLCGRLKELDLFDTTFEVAGIHDLLELRGAQLTHLRLINGIDGTTLDDNTLAVVARSGRRLRHLDLSFAQLTGAGIDAFARTVAAAHAEAQAQDPQHSIAGDRPGRYSLEFVRLVHCGGLQSSHIRSLVKDMPTMKTLDLRRCSVVGHDEEQRVVQIAREDGTIASVIVGE
ncbi:uncharacterized protein BJ171DRAFT_505631 [Polychytrium aggregatum]|uniref:uncharacterized protein n=1 Tax=Polychytrium aggregatum TaxID=110093 RepID=UPI0022FE6F71|nr:uncharacterized protein BJ171DRAFT_505631 [Polychytrium aggregatum]KAI9204366.1 hypothetical protein BJ171DRAFT_505631 [Polychytrium aggregatum]